MNSPKPATNSLMALLGTWLVDRVNIFFRVRRYLKMVSQRWYILAACTVVSLGFATYRALNSPDVYSASSKIGFGLRVVPMVGAEKARVIEELNNFYESNLGYLNGSKLNERVEKRVRDKKPAVQPYFSRLALKGSGSFTLIVESTDPEYAREYAKVWAEEFIEFRNELREAAFGSEAKTTREQIKTVSEKLDKARKELTDFKKTNNIANVKETGAAAQTRLEYLQQEYQQKKTQFELYKNKKAGEMANELRRIAPPTSPDKPSTNPQTPSVDDSLGASDISTRYNDLILQLRLKEADLKHQREILKPKHFYLQQLELDVAQKNEQLNIILALLEERRQMLTNSLAAEIKSYEPLIADLKREALDSNYLQTEYMRLEDDVNNIKRQLDELYKAKTVLEVPTTGGEDMLSIMEEGAGSNKPVRPNRPQMILAGLALGLGIGLAIIYLLGRLDDRIELADDIERGLEEQVLGQVPLVDTKKGQPLVLVTKLDEHNMFAESIRHIRSAVMFGSGGGEKHIMLVTSAIPGDGKTTVTVNFAVTLAIAGHRVLLVDADLRRGNTHSYFGGPRQPGFSEVLLGELHWSDVVKQTEVKTLHAIFSGKLPPNPGELLISPVTREFVAEARKSFDYIIFDCPPLTAIDDTFALAGLADGLVFVVRSGHTSLRFARTALEAVRQRGAKILGVVLNGITTDNPYYYYRNYYHAYYSKEQPRPFQSATTTIPAVKMAAPRNRFHQFASIDAEAKALAGGKVTPDQIAAEEQSKIEHYRRMVGARQEQSSAHDANSS
jgi:succinoglycan biosynthesis transport protein ExoP